MSSGKPLCALPSSFVHVVDATPEDGGTAAQGCAVMMLRVNSQTPSAYCVKGRFGNRLKGIHAIKQMFLMINNCWWDLGPYC